MMTINRMILSAALVFTSCLAARGETESPSIDAPPKNGMRFVVRTFSDEPLNHLYALQQEKGGKYRSVELMLHPRKPSRRVPWNADRHVMLYREEPGVETEDAQKADLRPEDLPPPFLIAAAPPDMSDKITALLTFDSKTGNKRVFYLDESSFSQGSLHAINFTSTPIRLTVSQKPDQSDKQVFLLAPFSNRNGLKDENIWHFSPRGNRNGTYALSVHAVLPSGQVQRLRSTRFNLSPTLGQINVFLRDASGQYSMNSISITQ